eukprot:2502300-Pleurochrysis_carterae.AAC.2
MDTESRNTGTWYPTDLRKPYLDKATDMNTYCQARQWYLWLKSFLMRSQITIWMHQLCAQFSQTCIISKVLSGVHDLSGQMRGPRLQH